MKRLVKKSNSEYKNIIEKILETNKNKFEDYVYNDHNDYCTMAFQEDYELEVNDCVDGYGESLIKNIDMVIERFDGDILEEIENVVGEERAEAIMDDSTFKHMFADELFEKFYQMIVENTEQAKQDLLDSI